MKGPALVDLIEAELDGRYESKFKTVQLNSTGIEIVSQNYERVALNFVNIGSYIAVIRPDAMPTTNTGFFLAANGGSLSLSWRDDLVLPGLAWYGLYLNGATTIYAIELSRYGTV